MVKSPVAFAYNLYQVILMRSALEHLKLLEDPRIKVRQWAIDRANTMLSNLNRAGGGGGDPKAHISLSMGDIKQLIEGASESLPESDKRLLNRGPFEPFEIVEGQIVSEETTVDDSDTDEAGSDDAGRDGERLSILPRQSGFLPR